jgi:hypothetical protein
MGWWKSLFGRGKRIDSPTPFGSLVDRLKHDDINIRWPALKELQRRAAMDSSLAPRIAECFASVMLYVSPDGATHFNNAAVDAIGDIGPQAESVVPKLIDLLHSHPSYSPSLGFSPASLSAAMESVERQMASLKRSAREALRKIGTPQALAALNPDEA